MEGEKKHRLLARQIKKFNIPVEFLAQHKDFFAAINSAYKSNDNDLLHLEKILELGSQELFEANQKLKKENILKSQEAISARNQLDHIMANVKDILIEMDAKGNFTYLNPAWIQYGEESHEESLGKNFMEFSNNIAYFNQEDLKSILSRDFEEDAFVTVFSKYNKAKELKWWEISVKILRDDIEEIIGAVVSLKDVTTLKNVETDLIAANKTKDRFLSTMSHEIRTPLNAVIAISNILSIQDPKPSQVENLEVLKYSSKNLLNLINDILDYNKLTTGKLQFEKTEFNLLDSLNHLVKSYSYLIGEKSVVLNLELDEKIHLGAKGDSTRLTQVLGNLLNNAIKFTKEGSVTLTIDQLEETTDQQVLRFKVSDTGIGIPNDKLEYIFERFTQAEHSTTKNFGGTGLGLAICRKILKLQGSDIRVESTLGKGTTFWFDLELEKFEFKNLLEVEKENDLKFDLSGLKLLIVDDNPINIMVATQFFDTWNIEYKEAEGAEEAITLFKEEDFDLILMDIQMPGKDGYETTKTIRALPHKNAGLPIIALSASTSHDIKEKVLASKMDDYLCKPFDPVDLYNKLKLYMGDKKTNTLSHKE